MWSDSTQFYFNCIKSLEAWYLKQLVRQLEEYNEIPETMRNGIIGDFKKIVNFKEIVLQRPNLLRNGIFAKKLDKLG